jgi:hypothetical protein
MSQISGRLSYANVMSTVAVFLALGGGVTLAAISGDGSVRFGAEKGFPVMEWSTVLNLPGIGKVQALCSKGGTGIRFKNTSGETLQASVLREGDGNVAAASLPQSQSLEMVALGIGDDDIDTMRFHMFKASDSGTPTVDITVSHQYGDASCEQRAAAAQAVASE